MRDEWFSTFEADKERLGELIFKRRIPTRSHHFESHGNSTMAPFLFLYVFVGTRGCSYGQSWVSTVLSSIVVTMMNHDMNFLLVGTWHC